MQRTEERVTNLELLFTHLERQVVELHKVVLSQQQKLEATEKQLQLLQQILGEENSRPEGADGEDP